MLNPELLTVGASIRSLIPNFKSYLGDLNGQAKYIEEQELEMGLGPEPTKVGNTAGEKEMYEIKKMSRIAYGSTIIRNLNKGLDVLSIVDEEGKEADEYRSDWMRNQMDRKLEILKQDYRYSMAFVEGSILNGVRSYKVKSPKSVTTFSTDLVNNFWADCAIEVFKNGGESYLRYYDATYILTFKKNDLDDDYSLEQREEHGVGVCPIVRISNKISSDGIASGDTELLKPVLDTLRQRTNSTSQAAYWTGIRQLVIEGFDTEEIRHDNDGNPYNVLERFLQGVQYTSAGIVAIPAGQNGETPTLKQTEEGNLGQLVETKKDGLNDLATLAGIPLHLLDGTKTPTTGEASQQAFMSLNDDKKRDKRNIGYALEMLMSQLIWATTKEWKELSIVWAVSEQVSINSLADTMSKMVAAGFPLRWIVRHVLAGYRPNQIEELLGKLDGDDELTKEQTSLLMDGLK